MNPGEYWKTTRALKTHSQTSRPGLHNHRPVCVPMASNEDAGIQSTVTQVLETLPLLHVPVFLAETDIAQQHMVPMKLPRTATASKNPAFAGSV